MVSFQNGSTPEERVGHAHVMHVCINQVHYALVWYYFMLNCTVLPYTTSTPLSTAVQAGMAPLHLTLCRKSLAGLKMQQGSVLSLKCLGIIWQCF